MDPLDAIKVTYFQECDELLAAMEEGLLAMDSGESDSDTINAVFRAVHSIKGGAGAFGFEPMVAFAHVFENAMDAMRSGKLDPDPEVVKLMLRASDVLADHVLAAKGEGKVDEARGNAMADELAALTCDEPGPRAGSNSGDDGGGDEWGFTPLGFAGGDDPPTGGWRLVMRPSAAMYAKGHDALLFLRELGRLGPIETTLNSSALAEFAAMVPENFISRGQFIYPKTCRNPRSAMFSILSATIAQSS